MKTLFRLVLTIFVTGSTVYAETSFAKYADFAQDRVLTLDARFAYFLQDGRAVNLVKVCGFNIYEEVEVSNPLNSTLRADQEGCVQMRFPLEETQVNTGVTIGLKAKSTGRIFTLFKGLNQ